MMGFLRRVVRSCAVVALLLSGPAWAGTYPERPVTIVVPFVAGGSSVVSARVVAIALS